MSRLELKINVTGNTTADLEDALDVIKQQIAQGYVSGNDRNDTGQYYYEIHEDCEED